MLVADTEFVELPGMTDVVVSAGLGTVLDDKLNFEVVELEAVKLEVGELTGLTLMLRLVLILVGVFRLASVFVLVLVLVGLLTLVLMAELLVGAITAGEIALEATGKLVIVVGESMEDEELLVIGNVTLLHRTL